MDSILVIVPTTGHIRGRANHVHALAHAPTRTASPSARFASFPDLFNRSPREAYLTCIMWLIREHVCRQPVMCQLRCPSASVNYPSNLMLQFFPPCMQLCLLQQDTPYLFNRYSLECHTAMQVLSVESTMLINIWTTTSSPTAGIGANTWCSGTLTDHKLHQQLPK